jgi:two-component system NtrC family sensor kinase
VANPLALMAFLFTALISLRYFLTAEELRRTYLELLHAEKMASLGTLSAGIVHEYRNFFTSISLAAEACKNLNLDREKINSCIQIIQSSTQRAQRISQGLLTFARKSESSKKEARLEKTIEEVLVILEKQLAIDRIQTVKEFENVGPTFYDEGQISQVIMNMIRNAADALKTKKDARQVVLRLKNAAERILLEIEDNGPGIPKKIRDRLFEPFVTSKKSGEGTGLGLSVCHGIIRNHGGEIKVKTSEGKGTLWQIFLPKK